MGRYRLTVEQRTRRQVLVYGQDEDTAKKLTLVPKSPKLRKSKITPST